MPSLPKAELLRTRLDVHDRKQLELKLEYEPGAHAAQTRYLVELFLFIPASLNVDADTWPAPAFYADVHNYVRFKTPVFEPHALLAAEQSPLLRLERQLARGAPEGDCIYQAKLLACALRGALRRFAQAVYEDREPALEVRAERTRADVAQVLARYRAAVAGAAALSEHARAAARLADEYMSLTAEQFFRRAVACMGAQPQRFGTVRQALMADVLREEAGRRERGLPSVIDPDGDNEAYLQRLGTLKKWCMNVLFLRVRRGAAPRQGWEEAVFALAAGLAMAFATSVALWAQERYTQVSLNFFLIAVVGYMVKDRIKEGLRRFFARSLKSRFYDRSARMVDPVTGRPVGTCADRVDFLHAHDAPPELEQVRRQDDLARVRAGEGTETVVRYQKEVVLDARLLPRAPDGLSAVTDILRLNVDRLTRDMDEPEYQLEYVDTERWSVGRVRGARRYTVDLALRTRVVGEGARVDVQLVRLVLDRNGLVRLGALPASRSEGPARSVA